MNTMGEKNSDIIVSGDSDFSAMRSYWSTLGRFYIRPATGDITVNGRSFGFRITMDNTGENKNIPTDRRVFTEMAPNLDEPNDHTAIYMLGFSETSAQTEGDFASVLFDVLVKKGYSNPKLLGLNACGKGTREYVENADLISRIGVLDEIKDIRDLVWMLLQTGKIQGDVSVISHSMGSLNAVGSWAILQEKCPRLIELMPCTDKPFGLTFSPQFLWTTRKHVGVALSQTIKRKGGVQVAVADHSRMMFSTNGSEIELNQCRDHWEASVPDSAGRFVGITLNVKRLPGNFVKPDIGQGSKAHVMQAGRDAVIPASMVKNEVGRLRRLGMEVLSDQPFVAQSFPHAIPMSMTREQRGELTCFLEEAYR